MTDPFYLVLKQQRKEIRERRGCSACAARGEAILGKYLCRLDHAPGKRGFCNHWKLDELLND